MLPPASVYLKPGSIEGCYWLLLNFVHLISKKYWKMKKLLLALLLGAVATFESCKKEEVCKTCKVAMYNYNGTSQYFVTYLNNQDSIMCDDVKDENNGKYFIGCDTCHYPSYKWDCSF